MSLRVTFDLDESDLQHFRLIMRSARRAAVTLRPEKIVADAREQLAKIGESGAPPFVTERLHKLRLMIEMLTDTDWRLPYADAQRVLNALAYFTEPEDIIPDHVPGLGFLDDAIMIELVVRELRHELDAYLDFRDFRLELAADEKGKRRKSREKWLARRRRELQERMRRRREAGGDGAPGRPELFDEP
jgi:hypothetical protein